MAGIVLAAGLSTRMGTPKQLLPAPGGTLLSRTLDEARRARLDSIVLVTTAEIAERLSPEATADVEVVVNPRPEAGQSSSLRLGLDAVFPRAEGALVLLPDQPGVTTELVNHLVAAFEAQPRLSVVATYQGTTSTPVLLSREVLHYLGELSGDTGARAVLAQHPEIYRTVEVGHLGTEQDLDTPQEYDAYRRSVGL